jgi:quercetin dioxygenase-like cupin family protein
MRKLYSLCFVVGIAVGTSNVLSAQAAKAPAKKAPAAKGTLWAASDLKWVDNPAIKGAQQAVLWGDPTKGAYGALKKVTDGTVLAMHSHTNLTRVVLVEGTITFTFEGSPAKELTPKSYVSVPGGVKHAATCKAGADCVYFETSPGAYDFKLVTPTN